MWLKWSMRIELTPLVLQALEIDWVVEETATLVKKARLRQAHTIYVSFLHRELSRFGMRLADCASQSEPCEGWKLSASTVRLASMLLLPRAETDLNGCSDKTRLILAYFSGPSTWKRKCESPSSSRSVRQPKTPVDRTEDPLLDPCLAGDTGVRRKRLLWSLQSCRNNI